MSESKEKIEAIKFAIDQARRIVNKLETIKTCSTLHKTQQYELDMAKHTVKMGEKLLQESHPDRRKKDV